MTCWPLVDELLDTMRSYMHLDETDHVIVALATAIAARAVAGEPLWLLVIGPPSSGKTETIRLLDDVADEHPDEVTAPSLLSWSKGKDPKRVGILARIPNPGFLTIADLSTVLATSDRGGRDQLFALLRRAYDGHVSRDLGNSPAALTWSGRLTLLAACTPAIDNYSSHADALGPRWLYCRIDPQNAATKQATGRKALAAGSLAEHRERARDLARQIVTCATPHAATVTLSDTMTDQLIDAAVVACYGRAAVERDGYGRREISGIAVIEEPPRLSSQLAALARGLLALGLDESETITLSRRCALDSVPRARLGAMQTLARAEQATVGEVARQTGCHRHVARMALEELDAIGIARSLVDEDDQADGQGFTPRPWVLAGPDLDLIKRVLNTSADAARKGGTTPPTPPIRRQQELLTR